MSDSALGKIRRERYYVRMVHGTRLTWLGALVGVPLLLYVMANEDRHSIVAVIALVVVGLATALGLLMSMSVRRQFERSLQEFQGYDSGESQGRAVYLREFTRDVLNPWRLHN